MPFPTVLAKNEGEAYTTNSIHVSTVKFTLWSVSKRSRINSSSEIISPVPSLSNLQYLALSFNRCADCTIDSSGCCLVSRNFVLSAKTNLFFGLIFLFITSPISLKISSPRFLGSAIVETFRIASHPAVARNMSVIWFYSPSLRMSLGFFFILASASKHLIHVFTYAGSSSVVRHPIGDALEIAHQASWFSVTKCQRFALFVQKSHLHTMLLWVQARLKRYLPKEFTNLIYVKAGFNII